MVVIANDTCKYCGIGPCNRKCEIYIPVSVKNTTRLRKSKLKKNDRIPNKTSNTNILRHSIRKGNTGEQSC